MKPVGRLIIGVIILVFLIIFILKRNSSGSVDKNEVKCQNEIPKFMFPLKNILSDEEILKVSASRQIFLIETNLNEERSLTKARQACSVESAAFTNPDKEIYFLFGTNSDGVNMKYSELIEALNSYPNIHLRYYNPIEFSKGTKLEYFFERDALNTSLYRLEHTSDVMRALTLNKYGGQYLDLDIISLTPLSTINNTNFACTETLNQLNGCIMNLDINEFGGKMISDKYLDLIDKEYSPRQWANNGPIMFTRAVKSFCKETILSNKSITKCGIFTTLPSIKCYPIHYTKWKEMFQDEHKENVLKQIEDADAYFIHVWNKMQDFDKTTFKLKFDSKSAYTHLAKTHCPKVYQTLVKYF